MSQTSCVFSLWGEGGGSEVAKQTAHQQWSAYQAAA